jgi:hypothetical protein
MRVLLRKLLFWSPRILTLLFIVFLLVPLREVATEKGDFWKLALSALIHLIPPAIIGLLLAISWRWALVGAMAFAVLGSTYIILAWGRFSIAMYLTFSGPMFLMSFLYFLNWWRRGLTFGSADR